MPIQQVPYQGIPAQYPQGQAGANGGAGEIIDGGFGAAWWRGYSIGNIATRVLLNIASVPLMLPVYFAGGAGAIAGVAIGIAGGAVAIAGLCIMQAALPVMDIGYNAIDFTLNLTHAVVGRVVGAAGGILGITWHAGQVVTTKFGQAGAAFMAAVSGSVLRQAPADLPPAQQGA